MNIEVNKIYTYKELCEAIGEQPITKGNGRNSQIKRIKQYCAFEKASRKGYLVTEAYDETRVSFNQCKTDLTNYLVCLMTNWMVEEIEQGNTEPIKTYRELLEDFCLVNSDYYKQRNNKKALAQALDLPQSYEINDRIVEIARWYDASGDVFSGVIERAIKQLRSRSLAEVHQSYRLFKEVDIGEMTVMHHHDCTNDEIKIIDEIKREAKERLGITNDKQLYTNKSIKIEYNQLVKSLIKEQLNYDYYIRSYKFISNATRRQAEYFKPKYNQLVVDKILHSPTMKQISDRINEQLTDGLVKC